MNFHEKNFYELLTENQVYTETLNSRNLKAENACQNDIMGFVNDEIMLRRIEKTADLKCQNVCLSVIFLISVKSETFIKGITQPTISFWEAFSAFRFVEFKVSV